MATGFYPDGADLFWRKDGEQIFEDVEHGEILPNHDGTFQMSVALKVEVTADVEGKYECVFQLSGVKEDLVTKLERRSILSNASHCLAFVRWEDGYTGKIFTGSDILPRDEAPVQILDLKTGDSVLAKWVLTCLCFLCGERR
ncbi:major histocompatibility complex class I-related gene protein-like [Nerophis ophidion]|uniref:major histocompatibility complex class I-related gene protein-like n=1 Tax=Nerophis ophidion TaxID=159077 RepID=UPI002AE0AFD2|nr:major histocompatibility complex class I-related gene protein-like [Nerophis ophidion]